MQIALDPPIMGIVGGGIDAQCVRCLVRCASALEPHSCSATRHACFHLGAHALRSIVALLKRKHASLTPLPLPLSRPCSCQRVAVAVRTDLPQSLLWCTVYCSEAAGAAGRQRAAAHLAAFLRRELDTALLEQRQQARSQGSGAGQQAGSSSSSHDGEEDGEGEEDEEDEAALDDYLQPPAMHRHWQPLITFVTVPELPRG